MLVFGDEAGGITLCDRDFQVSSRKERAFRGQVLGLAYLFDPKNPRRQFVLAVGDDSFKSDEKAADGSALTSNYAIKVIRCM